MSKGKILIVDDDKEILAIFKRIISKQGYEVFTALDRTNAKKIAFDQRPDLILLDVMLGKDSGIALMKALKSDERTSDCFIVLISGQMKSSIDQSEGLESGADGYLLKPINQRELLAWIDSFLKHKKSINALKLSEERSRLIINRNVDGILILDRTGVIRFANPAANNLFEKEENGLLDNNFGYPLVQGESTEINLRTKHGYDRISEMRTASLIWEGEEMTLATLRDITDRKRAEIRLKAQNEEIGRQNKEYKFLTEEYMVTNEELLESYEELRDSNKQLEKTRDELKKTIDRLNKSNKKLEQQKDELSKAKIKAEESEKIKTNFLASMAHELRSPLNAIIGFSNLIKPELNPHEITRFASIIESNGNNLLSIIDDTFNLALIDSGQASLRNELFSLDEFFTELNLSAEQLFLAFNKNEIKLEFLPHPGKEKTLLYSDKSKIQQILLNLLKNAFKFTKKGFIKYGFLVKKENIEFFVEDSGIGIPEDKKESIFERFQQLDSLPKTAQGAGLGLTISMELLHMLEGKMSVESEISKGSKFVFSIPRKMEKIEKQAEEFSYGPENIQTFLKDRNILVVEDDENNYLLIKALLEPMKARITHAWNGKQAVRLVDKNNYDCILMDLRLPFMNGFDSTKEIRKKNKKIPILAITAYAFKEELQQAMEAGCNDTIVKPLRKHELFGKMLQCLNN
ncbi:MAG: response regulator [Bacteroidales bacterium]|nr:response regulator [Bacteroidales bacterium]MCF8397790.1 response regulator [Bacteroidales bacterium]